MERATIELFVCMGLAIFGITLTLRRRRFACAASYYAYRITGIAVNVRGYERSALLVGPIIAIGAIVNAVRLAILFTGVGVP